jgi:cephalosporin-C deacetylase-like acetyl esterase
VEKLQAALADVLHTTPQAARGDRAAEAKRFRTQGKILWERGLQVQAIQSLDAAYALDPGTPEDITVYVDILIERASGWVREKDSVQALEFMRRALDVETAHQVWHSNAGGDYNDKMISAMGKCKRLLLDEGGSRDEFHELRQRYKSILGLTTDPAETSRVGFQQSLRTCYDGVPSYYSADASPYLQFRVTPARTLGLLAEPEKIEPGAPDPADFDAFWAAQIAALNATPMEPLVTPVAVAAASGQRILDVRLSCGPPVPPFTNAPSNYAYLYLGMPANARPGSLPAMVQFRGASCIGLGPHPKTMWYADCAIHAIVSPHSARNNWTPEEEAAIRASLKGWGYASMNAENREDYYMRGMILRILRALQYVKQQPEWNGKVLFLHGESQGGFQSLAAAALDPDASFCLAMVPAMSDHLGFRRGRRNGWPNVIKTTDGAPSDAFGRAAEQVLPYYDNVNFARRIRCETWIATGLLDTTCPPSSVCAVYNALPADTRRDLYLDPKAGHGTCNPAVLGRLEALIGKQ